MALLPVAGGLLAAGSRWFTSADASRYGTYVPVAGLCRRFSRRCRCAAGHTHHVAYPETFVLRGTVSPYGIAPRHSGLLDAAHCPALPPCLGMAHLSQSLLSPGFPCYPHRLCHRCRLAVRYTSCPSRLPPFTFVRFTIRRSLAVYPFPIRRSLTVYPFAIRRSVTINLFTVDQFPLLHSCPLHPPCVASLCRHAPFSP